MDALSHFPSDNKIDARFLTAGASTVYIILIASDNKTRELQESTMLDTKLMQLKTYTKDDWPNVFKKKTENLKCYWRKKPEL